MRLQNEIKLPQSFYIDGEIARVEKRQLQHNPIPNLASIHVLVFDLTAMMADGQRRIIDGWQHQLDIYSTMLQTRLVMENRTKISAAMSCIIKAGSIHVEHVTPSRANFIYVL